MSFEPKIVGFLCNWCSYTGADLAGTARIKYSPNIRSIRVMCSGRIEPTFIMKALYEGADGVLIAGCHPGDCHYQEGNYKALRRYRMLKKVLPDYGIDPGRIRLEWVAASEGEKFANVVDDFTEEIRNLGPLGIKEGLDEMMKDDVIPHHASGGEKGGDDNEA
ncbi:MAG: hydrogenase iron-sulfur subunit [Candidatus Krumholzibacteria bacterium]|nr:hydrogenase iron-sulfur subunit [Candidatus Krumholzibacteria bacterium]